MLSIYICSTRHSDIFYTMPIQVYSLFFRNYILFILLLFASLSAFAQPANDACTAAIVLPINQDCVPQVFNNVNATQSEIGEVPDCFNGGAIDRDVWFTFSLPRGSNIENVKITLAKTTENSIDLPQMALYRGACEAGELSFAGVCASAELADELLVLRAIGLTSDIQYFIRVNDYSQTATPNWGNFSLCLEILPPVFNMGEAAGTSLCAGTLYDSGGPDGNYAPNEEETFTICPTDFHQCIQIEVVTYDTEVDFDEITLFDGADNQAELLRAISGEGSQTLATAASACVTVNFDSDFFTQGEGFELTWRCTPSVCPPQEERSCAEPHTITSLPFEATDLTTCFSGNNIEDGPCSNDGFLSGEEYIFAYTSNGGACISIVVSGVIGKTGVSVMNGCPEDNLSETVCFAQNNEPEEGRLVINNISLREAGTYYIAIAHEYNCTPFTIAITPSEDCPMVFPSAAQCNNALVLNGCDTALPVALTVEPGQGEVDFFQAGVNNGCWEGVLETNYTWFTFEAQADGEFAFILSNNIQNETLDIDFNIWGPFQSLGDACSASYDLQPLRSSWADNLISTITGLTNVNPLLGTPVTETCQGAVSDGFVRPIEVRKGEVYVVLVNDFDGVIFNGAVAIDFSESSPDVLGPITETVGISDDTSICIGESTTLAATGGSLYEWFPKEGLSCISCPNPTASPNETTTYTVNINTVCNTISRAVTVEVYDLDINAAEEVCLGASLSLEVSDNRENVQFEWTSNSVENPLSCMDCPTPTIMANTLGVFQYSVLLTTPLCELRDTYQLTVREGMAFDFMMQENQSICKETSVELGGAAVMGNTYTWTTSGGTILSNESNLQVMPDITSTYFLRVENENCTVPVRDSVIVEVFESPMIELLPDTTVCQGTTLRLGTFQAQQGISYLWSATASSFSSTAPNPTIKAENNTTVTLTARNGGCSETASVNLSIIPIEIAFQQPENFVEICLGDSLLLNPILVPANAIPTIKGQTGGLDTIDRSIKIVPSTNENYIATISNAGCTAADTLVVKVDSLPSNMQIMPSDTMVCEGSQLIFESPLYDPVFYPTILHKWIPDAGFETPDSFYNLVLTATDSVLLMRINTNGACVDTSTAFIAVTPVEDILIDPAGPICLGNSLTLQATIPEGAEELQWMPEGSTSCTDCPNPTISPSTSTTYTLSGMLNNCPISGTQSVEVIDGAIVSINSDSPTDIFQGETVSASIVATAEIIAIEWLENDQVIRGQSNSNITYEPVANQDLNGTPRTVLLTANVTTIDGCMSLVSLSILVTPPIETMPNAFTPDGDGNNDFFNLIIEGPPATILSFKIYNRWGKQVYNNETPSQGWDGRFQGERQNPDVYMYVIEYQVGERIASFSGDVTLIR